MPELAFFRRGEEVLRFGLERGRVVIGRGEKCDVVVPDPAVSRTQAAITLAEGRCLLDDLSGKGTMVAGKSHSSVALADGEDIALGQWRAVFRARSAADPDQPTDVQGDLTSVQPRETSKGYVAAQVRVRQGRAEEVHKLSLDSFTVGKDPGNDLVVPDQFLSGRHLKVSRCGDLFHVTDQTSTNGTFVGNLRLFEAEVPFFTTLRVGETELTLEPGAVSREETSYYGMVGKDASLRRLAELIERAAPSSVTIAIFGESGTGKELVARAVHARSLRADKPFIPVNCPAISKELAESELFGHEKGSFTGATNARGGAFEEADGGTLFLDEVGELSSDLQAKLLRVLESGEIKRVGASRPIHVDVRVVAATNRDLLAATREGTFREDLYYRLCVVPLHVPPLRNRPGDVIELADHFVRQSSPHGQTVRFTPAALDRLQAHTWPGNIRELKNVVTKAVLLRNGPMIDAVDLTFDAEVSPEVGTAAPELLPGMTLEQMHLKYDRQIIEAALRRFNNNRERVAKELGIARSALFKRLRDWGLTRQDETQ